MARNDTTSKIIDETLRLCVSGTVVAAGIMLPNLLIALDKPLQKYLKHLDKREREREAKRIISYMKSQSMLTGDYAHGLRISRKGKERLQRIDFDNLTIPQPKSWDHTWRLVFYDIPESHRSGRKALTVKLRELGFMQLQRSAWIHPFPCREVIEKVTSTYAIEKYVSYIQTPQLDNQAVLIRRFQKRLPTVRFK